MRPVIRRLTTAQVETLLRSVTLTRKIDAVHLHHTWVPTRSQFRGQASLEAMRDYHTTSLGWDDIAQHLTIDPQGFAWTGRNWNLPPASQRGRNGRRAQGPFMIEMVGDFNIGRDALDGEQRQAVVDIVAAILAVHDLAIGSVQFHNELGSPKTCPGTSIDKAVLMAHVAAAVKKLAGGKRPARARKGAKAPRASAPPFGAAFVLGADVAADPGAPAPGFESWEIRESAFAARDLQEATTARSRATARGHASVPAVLARAATEWSCLRPHVVNLSEGRLSLDGEFRMDPDSIDGIVDAIRDYAQTAATPRVMLHAHGGLVKEKDALAYARGAYSWWLDQGVYPVYFIWETGALEVIRNTLGMRRGLGDVVDALFEKLARPVCQPLWSEMKEYALLASSDDADDGEAGGARIFAQALAGLVRNPPQGKNIALHAVGHSAGAIFHSHFVPLLIDLGLDVESLAFLAPAARVDLFTQMVVPHLTQGHIGTFEIYTMDEEAEKDDNLVSPLGVPLYGKSLLYLISRAMEPEDDAPLLGLDECLRGDAGLGALFPPKGTHRLELSHAKGKPHNPATRARKHGCFDNDAATMQSLYATITGGSTDKPFPVKDPACEKASSRALFAARAEMSGASAGARRALCVGIDGYRDSPLEGCVRDARTWAGALGTLGFDVTTLLDAQATRESVLRALSGLVDAARPGDTLVFQYSGHGTQVDDLNGDERDRYDEALVPIDYDGGALLLDDDLAEIYRRVPQGVVLTLFMDCCHSGTNSRFRPLGRDGGGAVRRRFLELTPEQQSRHEQFRVRAGSSALPASPEESWPGVVHFAACLDNEYAYESEGQGHFTRIAVPRLAGAVAAGVTNEGFAGAVAAEVIALGRPQTPRLMRLPGDLAERPLLARAGGVATGAMPWRQCLGG